MSDVMNYDVYFFVLSLDVDYSDECLVLGVDLGDVTKSCQLEGRSNY